MQDGRASKGAKAWGIDRRGLLEGLGEEGVEFGRRAAAVKLLGERGSGWL